MASQRSQLNVRIDSLSEMLFETLMERTGEKTKTDLLKKMIFSYSQQHLSPEELESVISLAVMCERS